MTKLTRPQTAQFETLCAEAAGSNDRAVRYLKNKQPDLALAELYLAQEKRLEAKQYVCAQKDIGKAEGTLYRLRYATDHYIAQAQLVIEHRDRGPRPGLLGRIADFLGRPGFPIPEKESTSRE